MKKRIVSVILILLMLWQLGAVMSSAAATVGVLTYTVSDGTVTITECDRDAFGMVTIPTTLGGYPVTSIDDEAFFGCDDVTGITIPKGVTSIGDSVFYWCTGLTSINVVAENTVYHSEGNCLIETATKTLIAGCQSSIIPADGSVTRIGDGAFNHCIFLKSIIIPASVTSIGDAAFSGCYALARITISSGVTGIGDRAFSYCSGLTGITIPASVSKIGTAAFEFCSQLRTVNFSDGLKEIGSHAFSRCIRLKQVYIPASVSKIGTHAFENYKCCITALGICVNDGYFDDPDLKKPTADPPVICGFAGTAAEKYAKSNNITFKEECDKFTDVTKSDWYHKNGAIHYVVDKGLFSGTSTTTFSPEQNMTRAMFVTVLGRLDGQSVNNKVTTKFADVKTNQYYTGYVKWGTDNGIVAGLSALTFGPDENVTREQICALMVRYCDYAGITLQAVNTAITFEDAGEISSYAEAAVYACQQGGLVNGEAVSGGYSFRPQGNATRAEVATIIMNFAKTYK